MRLERRWRSGAIVIGGDYRGLGVARSLGRRGIPVWVLHDEHLVATFSRYVMRSFGWPHGCDQEQIDLLYRLAGEEGLAGWTLFPTGDETAAFVARNHDVLSSRFRLTIPPWEVLRYAYDKRLTYQRAAELGIDHPRSVCVGGNVNRGVGTKADRDGATVPTKTNSPFPPRPRTEEGVGGEGIPREIAAHDLQFPVILKPAWKEGLNAFTRAKAWRADDRDELEGAYREAATLVPAETIVIQELVPGGGEAQFSYATLAESGRPRVEVTARRTRQYPPEFGYFSTFVESITCPEIEEPSRRFIQSLGFTGLVELEYKFDARDRTFKLLDVNPRVWGWHTLGRRAGGDFPYLAWMQSRGERLEPRRVPPGRRWCYATTDAMAAFKMIRGGQMSIGGYMRSLQPGTEEAVFAMDDPLPGILDVPLAVRRQRRKAGAVSLSPS